MFKKILIANRGEIAVRVMRGCKELGIGTVAVYSEADEKALHVLSADEAVCIGPAPPTESYLNIETIIKAAQETGSEAVHPGYGFLAENHHFAKACEDAGLTFIGPTPKAIKILGNKIEARKLMIKAGVPVIPGMLAGSSAQSKNGSYSGLRSEAKKIGYPVLVKAAAGGGGKGMRVVHKEKDLKEAMDGASREAQSAFGDGTVYIEKFLEKPRHIEFQILADNFGNVIHLNERECSIQRRKQKIVEESPSPALDETMRQKMGEIAVLAAKSAGYTNAGTVEMLLDTSGKFYFLEVNTRLQVEHPVTELTAGIDLVHEQIKIALGEKLSISQEDVTQTGHAIEVRIYAEDPDNGFLPSSGDIIFTKEPTGEGVRVDSGIYSGCNVPVYYDPILSKLIVHAHDRKTAVKRMKKALSGYPVLGVKTSVDFLKKLMDNTTFRNGDLSTDFLERESEYFEKSKNDRSGFYEASIAAALCEQPSAVHAGMSPGNSEYHSPWTTIGSWSIAEIRGNS